MITYDTDYLLRRPVCADEIFLDPETGKAGRVIANQTDLAHNIYLVLKYADGKEGLIRYICRLQPTIEETEAFERAEKRRG